MKDKKTIYKITSIFLIIIVLSIGIINFIIAGTPRIKTLKVNDKINEDYTKTITLTIHNPFDKNVKCAIETSSKTNKSSSHGHVGSCRSVPTPWIFPCNKR